MLKGNRCRERWIGLDSRVVLSMLPFPPFRSLSPNSKDVYQWKKKIRNVYNLHGTLKIPLYMCGESVDPILRDQLQS